MKTYQMFIGGQWVEAVSGSTFDDFDSYSGEIYTKVAEGDAQDADRAMAAAFTARKEWAATPAAARAQILNKAARLLEAETQEFADVLIREGGRYSVEELTEVKWFTIQKIKRLLPF